MGRKKLGMELIENKKKRTTRFNIRKPMVMKKASELSTLCDVEVCVIIFGPRGENSVWPNEPEKVNKIITRYKNTPIEDRRKRALNLSHFCELRNGQPRKVQLVNGQGGEQCSTTAKFGASGDQNIGFSAEQLLRLYDYLNIKLEIVNGSIDLMKRSQNWGKCEEVMVGNMQVMPTVEYRYYHDEQQRMRMLQQQQQQMMNNVNVGECSSGSFGGHISAGLPMLFPSPLTCPDSSARYEQFPPQTHLFDCNTQLFKNESTHF